MEVSKFGKTHEILVVDDNGWDLKNSFGENDYNFTGENYRPNLMDDQFEFPAEWGTGVKIIQIGRGEPFNEKVYFTDKCRKNWKVNLEISTFIGVSFGAQHYYAYLQFDSPRWRTEDMGENSSTNCFDEPAGFDFKSLNLTRALTQKEIKKDPDRYNSYKKGTRVNLWYTYDVIVKRAKEIFPLIFKDPRWELIIPEENKVM
ncbi:MAG: hypothetical protein HC831_21955 [Chloroflexia bacterium]|nr:hypothetical protein [Chloroflexia bacterium]